MLFMIHKYYGCKEQKLKKNNTKKNMIALQRYGVQSFTYFMEGRFQSVHELMFFI